MKNLAKQIVTKIHLLEFAKEVRQSPMRIKRRVRNVDRSIIENYFSTFKVTKLHIGCGKYMIDSWLNSDLFPTSDDVLHLDATNTFPFENDTFDYIFSEHMIEHLSYSNGFAMLSECQRVLKRNGKIRISTPDLQFLINLYQGDKSELQIEYIKWATDQFIKGSPYPDDVFVINNFVRDWGHLFIYDEKTLRSSLERAGFADIIKCELNESESEGLRNLENEGRMPRGFLKLRVFYIRRHKITQHLTTCWPPVCLVVRPQHENASLARDDARGSCPILNRFYEQFCFRPAARRRLPWNWRTHTP